MNVTGSSGFTAYSSVPRYRVHTLLDELARAHLNMESNLFINLLADVDTP